MNGHFPREEKKASCNHKIKSISVQIRKVHIKPAMSCPLVLVRVPALQAHMNAREGKDHQCHGGHWWWGHRVMSLLWKVPG